MAGWNAQASSFPESNLVFYLELNLASFNRSLHKKKTFVKELQVISLSAKYRRNRSSLFYFILFYFIVFTNIMLTYLHSTYLHKALIPTYI